MYFSCKYTLKKMFQFIISTLERCTTLLAWVMFGLALFTVCWPSYSRKKWIKLLIGQRKVFILCTCIMASSALFTISPLPVILLNIFILLLSGHVIYQSYFYQVLQQKVSSYIFPNLSKNATISENTTNEKERAKEENDESEEMTEDREEKSVFIFTEEKIKLIHQILDSPVFLYNPDISINQLAREVAVNTTYLSRYFNRQLGLSFPEYITVRRLDRAEELLKNTDMKVVDIFEQVGFQNSSTFYQVFNDRHQISPLQWRKNIKCN